MKIIQPRYMILFSIVIPIILIMVKTNNYWLNIPLIISILLWIWLTKLYDKYYDIYNERQARYILMFYKQEQADNYLLSESKEDRVAYIDLLKAVYKNNCRSVILSVKNKEEKTALIKELKLIRKSNWLKSKEKTI